MPAPTRPHAFVTLFARRCGICGKADNHPIHSVRLNHPLARVLFERAQDGYVNPTGGKTTGRERKDA